MSVNSVFRPNIKIFCNSTSEQATTVAEKAGENLGPNLTILSCQRRTPCLDFFASSLLSLLLICFLYFAGGDVRFPINSERVLYQSILVDGFRDFDLWMLLGFFFTLFSSFEHLSAGETTTTFLDLDHFTQRFAIIHSARNFPTFGASNDAGSKGMNGSVVRVFTHGLTDK